MWRFDASRSGATPHALPADLNLQWQRTLPPPDPAFDYHFRLCADVSYEPVAAGGLLFLPSNVSDSVAAYDLATGQERWRFITEGPVRFAPVVAGGRVWFGSDDGHLYCVEAATGALRWKVRGAPNDRGDYRMLVNGRMSSRWPARGGPLLVNDSVFFGCGLWPSEGVFVLAVNADTGAVRWRNAEISQIADGLEEHGRMADLGLPPHGYLTLLGGKLALPSGRALAAFLDPQSGKLDPYNSYYAKFSGAPRGAWAVTGSGDFWFQGGAIHGTSPAVIENLPIGPMSVEEFARFFRQPAAWVEQQIKSGALLVQARGPDRRVLLDPRSPLLAFALESPKKPATAGQMFQLENRPTVSLPEIGTRHEIDVRSLPVFTGALMLRNEFKDAKDWQIERGETHVRPPTYDLLRAYDLRRGSWQLQTIGRSGEVQRRLQFEPVWEMATPLVARIVAGDRLYAAGENKIAAIALPAPGGQPQVVWQADVKGFPVGVIATQGRLVVTTDTGRLYCFGPKAVANAPLLAEQTVTPAVDETWASQVETLRTGGISPGGYALVLGWNSGGLARELVRQTALAVVVVEADAATAARARSELTAAGYDGSRAQVIGEGADKLQLPPYFAELVVTEDFSKLSGPGPALVREALEALRPGTGQALLRRCRPKLHEFAEAHGGKIGGFALEADGKFNLRVRRTSAPTGADDWTHEAGPAGNTFSSADRLAVPPFGLLWYSGGIDRHFSPAFEYHHNRNPYPTFSAGRLFLLAGNDVHAIDAYTGRHLWQARLAESDKAGRRLSDHRKFSRPTDHNIIAAPDRVYVFRDADAQVLDPANGTVLAVFELPPELPGAHRDAIWDEVRMHDDLLLVAARNQLVALDRYSGSMRWSHRGEQEHIAFAVGGGQVFVVDYLKSRAAAPKAAGEFTSELLVLNASTGARMWSAPLKAPARPEQTPDSVARPTWAGVFADNPLKPVLAYSASGTVLAIVDRSRLFAFEAVRGELRWHRNTSARLADLVGFEPPVVTKDFVIGPRGAVLDVRTGEPAGEIGGRGTGCNRYVGSDALITFRSALACVYDLNARQRIYLSSTRSGCTNSMIPAGGLLNAPNFAHGCVCNYPFLTSFALVHLPAAAAWSRGISPEVQTQRNPNAN